MDTFTKKTLLTLCAFIAPVVAWAEAVEQPNIIIFYADDLGWQDTELNDVDAPVPWETPSVMRLAKDSINFTEGYSPSPVCAPSRISLLTGVHPANTGMTSVRGSTPEVAPRGARKLVSPYHPSHMDPAEYTIAEALRDAGYATAHVGKWHVGHLESNTTSKEVGFEYVSETRGITQRMRPDRLSDFATTKPNDRFRIDPESGRPYDPTTGDALTFLEQISEKEQPFFLYLAHWLVHAPIQTRDRALLEYYCEKMGIPFPTDPSVWTTPGQNNPYYAAMVATLDHSLKQVLDFLDTTEDPRNPGKLLAETTYIFFSSDNGGMERAGDIITDNAPLDKGKISAREGGVRVPLLIRGPAISPSVSRELVNGLDFYPTILSMTGASGKPEQNARFDGVDLLPYLLGEEAAVLDDSGNQRDTLYWHFPHGRPHEHRSSMRKGDFKLYKNYLTSDYSLYRLDGPEGERLDWEEANDLIDNPEYSAQREEMIALLEAFLEETGAKPSYFNPRFPNPLPGKDKVPVIVDQSLDAASGKAMLVFDEEDKTPVKKVYFTYTENPGKRREFWKQIEVPFADNKAEIEVPEGATHFIFSLIDENNFIQTPVSVDPGNNKSFVSQAIAVKK